jgi:hypothetical protein
MISEKEKEEIRVLVRKDSTEKLKAKLQHFHQRKLVDGLIVPGRREQLDALIEVIQAELASRQTLQE